MGSSQNMQQHPDPDCLFIVKGSWLSEDVLFLVVVLQVHLHKSCCLLRILNLLG